MEKNALLNGYRLNKDYTTLLVEDVREEDMAAQPHGFCNHPAFTLGHLVSATCLTIQLLGAAYEIPAGWDEVFRRKGPGDPQRPTDVHTEFPAKQELISVFLEKFEESVTLIEGVTEEKWNEQVSWKLARYMPTVGELLHFQCLMHNSWHIGQLAEWRRLMGYDSALAKMT